MFLKRIKTIFIYALLGTLFLSAPLNPAKAEAPKARSIKILPSKVAAPSAEEPKNFSVGGKLVYFLPGVGLQSWFDNNLGVGLCLWPLGSTTSGVLIYQGNLFLKTNLGRIKPVIGLGYVNSLTLNAGATENGTGMLDLSFALSLGDKDFYFLPALEILIGNGTAIPLFTIGFYWWI